MQMLLQRRQVELLEWATVTLPASFAGKADDLRTSERILSLEMAFFAIRVLDVINIVLIERRAVDLWIPCDFLPPPSHGFFHREPAIFQEGPELQPSSMLQVFLSVALRFHDSAHARWERLQ